MCVRLAAMRGIDNGYRAARSDEREAYHAALAYFSLLSDGERLALSRRFPGELAAPPSWLPGAEHTRAAWDTRCRELVLAMLAFGERVRSSRMEFVRRVEVRDDSAVMVLTASGSTFELGRPAPDGTRHMTWRGDRRGDETEAILSSPLEVERAARLGYDGSSDVILIARGEELPAAPGPAADASDIAELRARLREAVGALDRASGITRRAIQDKAVALACEIQNKVAPYGGHQLHELAWFESGSGSRYEVMQHDGLDLVRRAPEELACVWMHDADIRSQTIVEGAPLIIFYSGPRAAHKVAFVFNIAASQAVARVA
jgi:hypothetical protein